MVKDGQGTTWRRNIAENFNRLSRVHERYRRQTTDRQTDDRQTDGPSMAYSEHELEFTFANNKLKLFQPRQSRISQRTSVTHTELAESERFKKNELPQTLQI